MKDPRDLLLLGTGFLLGMTFCYFVAVRGPAPAPGGSVTLVQTPAPIPATMAAAPRLVPLWISNSLPASIPLIPPRHEPLINHSIEWHPLRKQHEPTSYDLIDTKYQPDFKIP